MNEAQQAAWEQHLERGQRLFAAIERLVFGAPGSQQEARWDEFMAKERDELRRDCTQNETELAQARDEVERLTLDNHRLRQQRGLLSGAELSELRDLSAQRTAVLDLCNHADKTSDHISIEAVRSALDAL